MAIAQSVVSTSSSTLYSSSGTSAVTAMYFMNNHTQTIVIQLHVVTSGNTISTNNKIIKDLSIAAGDTYVIDTERLVLDDGDSIRATSDTDDGGSAVVYATISYIGV